MKLLSIGCLLAMAAADVGHAQTLPAPPPYVASPMRRTIDDTNRSTGFRPVGNGTVLSGRIRFAQLAQTVRNPAGRLIVDKTGLDGFYEFSFEWAFATQPAGAAPDSRPNIFTAFQEQLGLKLEPSTTAVEVVVIDHIERPTPD